MSLELRQRVMSRGVACEEGIKQHVLFHVLLLGAVADQRQRAAIIGQAAEIEILRQHHHVMVARVEELHRLAEDHRAQAEHAEGEREGIGGGQQLGRRPRYPGDRATARCHHQLQLVERHERDLGVGKQHLDATCGMRLKIFHVDVIARHAGWEMRACLLHFACGARAVGLRRRHDLGNADLDRLELQQQEQPLEDRYVEPSLRR